MGRRNRRDPGERDSYLTLLSRAEAAELREMVRVAFAELGRECTIFGDHVTDDQDTEFRLVNLASDCHFHPKGRRAWPDVVAAHVRKVSGFADDDPLRKLSREEILAHTYVRLFPSASPMIRDGLAYATKTMPGLLEVITVALQGCLVTLKDEMVEILGGLASLRTAGLANLKALPLGQQVEIQTAAGLGFHAVMGKSPFTSSLVISMPDLLMQLYGAAGFAGGVLTCIPTGHFVGLHPVEDKAVFPALQLMANFAAEACSRDDERYRLSPFLYWWRDGNWEQLAEVNEEGELWVIPQGDFREILDQIEERDL